MDMKSLMTFAPLVLLVVIMYFLLIRPQKKREREVNTMRANLKVGDEIITIGGICGKIVKTKEESLVIQVGADKVKFEVMRWAISKVTVASDRPVSRSEEPEDAEEAEEAPKKSLPRRMKRPEPKEADTGSAEGSDSGAGADDK
ncbi:MAG: preprotein translocase subunit YajC [Anaerovoracaceae bacterium]|jgi:preprotein translocase subunit YajC